MSKEKVPYNKVSLDNSEKKLTDIHSSTAPASDIENLKKIYLSESNADYHPSEESIEHANGLSSSKLNPVETLINNNQNI